MRFRGRAVIIAIGSVFALYHLGRSFFQTEEVAHPILVIVTALVVALVTFVCMLAPSPRSNGSADAPLTAGSNGPSVLPVWAVVLALMTAVLAPTANAISVGESHVTAPFATGYVGGVGLVMTVVMVRRRPVCAWVGVGNLGVGTIAWMGLLEAFTFGMVGAITWVAVAQLIVVMLDRAARDTMRFVELQRAAAAWQAAHSVRRRERRVRVQFALQTAGPLLTRIIAQQGELSDESKLDARVAEGTLRDEMRGPQLIDDRVRSAIEAARRRGSTVTILDEGGLDDLDEPTRARVRGEIAEAITETPSPRLIVRSSHHPEIAVTVVGRAAAADGLSDDDAVELWREIARHG